jgi:hypothetical protein
MEDFLQGPNNNGQFAAFDPQSKDTSTYPTLGTPTRTTAGVSSLMTGALRNDRCISTIPLTGSAANCWYKVRRASTPSSFATLASRAVSAFLALATQSFPASSICFLASWISSYSSRKGKHELVTRKIRNTLMLLKRIPEHLEVRGRPSVPLLGL